MKPRSAIRLLVDPVFGRFFWSKVFSLTGMWAQNIAAALVMWDITHSATMVGAITVAQFAAILGLAPLTGALTDIVDRRRLLIIGRLLSAAATAVLVVIPLAGRSLTAGMLLIVTGFIGLGLAVSSPALQALVPALVRDEELEQAVALNALVGNIARAIGPVTGTTLLAVGGPEAAFAFAALGYLVMAVALIGLTPPTQRAAQGRRRILDGVRYLRGDRNMALLLLGTAGLSFGVDPIITITPTLAESIGTGDAAVGAMASAFGAGAVVAAAFQSRLRRRFGLRRLGMLGFAILTAGLLVVAVSLSLLPVLAGFTIAGLGFLVASTALTTLVQRRVPEELRGRIMALWTVAFLGFRPIAAVVNGVVTDVANVRAAVVLGAAIVAASAFTARVSYGQSETHEETATTTGVSTSTASKAEHDGRAPGT